MKKLFFVFAVVGALSMYFAHASAQAVTLGGPGGSRFSFECPRSSGSPGYVTGVTGRAGNAIDALKPICDGKATGATTGGRGGEPFALVCPPGAVAVGIQLKYDKVVEALQLMCVKKFPYHVDDVVLTGRVGDQSGVMTYTRCPGVDEDERIYGKMTGFGGRSGDLIDSIYPLCGP